jgi:hypothetical protein
LLVFGPAAAQQAEQEVRFFRIGTGPTNSPLFPIGTAIAAAISNPPGSRACERGGSCGVPGVIGVAQTTAGSTENVAALAAGTFESALSQADVAFLAYSGEGGFKEPGAAVKLRAIANLFQVSLHIVVRADSGITAVGGLKGMRVALGEKGSGNLETARLLLKAYNLSEKKVKPAYLGLEGAAAEFLAGKLDAVIAVTATPDPVIASLAEATPIALLPITDAPGDAFRVKYPFLSVDVIPKSVYAGIEPTVTVGLGVLWLVNAELDEALAHDITQALWHPATRKLLDESNPIGRKIRVETALFGIPIPLHAGAARYYTEAGWMESLPTGSP